MSPISGQMRALSAENDVVEERNQRALGKIFDALERIENRLSLVVEAVSTIADRVSTLEAPQPHPLEGHRISARTVFESLIPLAVEEVKPLVTKLWHLVTGEKDDTTVAKIAAQAGRDLAGRTVHYVEEKYGLNAAEKLAGALGQIAAQQQAWAIANEESLSLQKTLEEQLAIRKEMQATIDDLERQVAHYQALASGGVE